MRNELRNHIESEYAITVHAARTIHHTPKTFVCKLTTNRGTYALKTLYKPEARQQFVTGAENYLRGRGIHIPETLSTKTNKHYTMVNGYPYALQKWVPGRPSSVATLSGIKLLGALLGKMHKASVGYQSQHSSLYAGYKLWTAEYKKDLRSIDSWRKKHKDSQDPKIKSILKYTAYFKKAGKKALQSLLSNDYFLQWKEASPSTHYLCHGDFHTGNVLISQSNCTIIDWEDVRYDFPSKDIARLLFVSMRSHRRWSRQLWNALFTTYLQENPLSRNEKNLLYIDLTFPHLFERYLRKQVYRKKTLAQVNTFLRSEMEKTEFMKEQIMV